MRSPALVAAAALTMLVVATSCGADPERTPPQATASSTPSTAPSVTPPPSPSSTPTSAPRPRRGIDASHHQGPIDWAQVADAGIEFSYLKATEGTGFTDPRFAEHRRAAHRAGIDIGGYHYFQLCSDGADQAAHLIAVLGDLGRRDLPPAVDLELLGSCDRPLDRTVLLAEVTEFLDTLELRYGSAPVVYLYPDFEDRYGFAADLADHPQWVRRLGSRPPRRDWSIWQYDEAGSVPGIAGGVDLNRSRG